MCHRGGGRARIQDIFRESPVVVAEELNTRGGGMRGIKDDFLDFSWATGLMMPICQDGEPRAERLVGWRAEGLVEWSPILLRMPVR